MKDAHSQMRYCVGFAVCLVLFGGQGSMAQGAYKPITVSNGGTIDGRVSFNGTNKDKKDLEVTKDERVCGRSKPAQTLVVGKNYGVQNAVIYLEGITEGKKWAASKTSALDQRGCDYSPHVSIIPSGGALEIVNDDPILHNVHLYNFSSVDQTICNIAQPVKGQRTKVDQVRTLQCGFLHATCDAGHPWMSAYIVRADNPYYVLTDKKGEFKLTGVPAGTYKLTMWHEGVKVTKTLVENGKVSKYYFEEPYATTKLVTVLQDETVHVDFQLAVRQPPDDRSTVH